MKRMLVLVGLVALALPAAAAAKGPTGAEIQGPGAGGGIDVTGTMEPGSQLGDLTTWSGFFPAAFHQTPDPMLDARPEGDLGPKYTVTYIVPGGEGETWTIEQGLYPYAKRGPVTYMKPGQEIFSESTRGGWYMADIALKELLDDAGLPATPPPSTTSADDEAAVSTGTVLLLAAAAALLLIATALFLRRRTRAAVTA